MPMLVAGSRSKIGDRKMKNILWKTLTLMCFCLLVPSATMKGYPPNGGQPENSVEGIWQGTLDGLRIIFRITTNADAELVAFLDSPDQKQVGALVDKVSFNNNTLRLEIKRFNIVYEGQIQQNGSTIQGHWKQAGCSDPLVLGRFDTGPVVARPQNPKKPLPYNCEQIVYENESAGLKLAGTLTLPVQGGPFPAALLLQGSGPLDRNEFAFGHQPFTVLADYLTRHGIAVMRVDKRGIWQSTGDFSQATTADFAADTLAAVEYLRTRKEINPKHIGLIGHSEGGIIAPMVAAQTDHVHFIVLVSAPGMDLKAGRLLQEKLLTKA